MAYGRGRITSHKTALGGAAVSHSAELVRGNFIYPASEGPLIRPFGHLLPKGRRHLARARGRGLKPPR